MPAYVLAAASRGTPADLAQALAAAGGCFGVIALAHAPGEVTNAWALEAREPSVPLSAATGAFVERHREYHVEDLEGFGLVADVWPIPADNPLSRRQQSFEGVSVSAVAALRALVNQISSQPTTGGRVGSYLGKPGEPAPDEEDLMGPIVSLRAEDATVFEILVAIGRQSPGVVWIAENEPRTGRIVLKAITRAGVLSPIGALSE